MTGGGRRSPSPVKDGGGGQRDFLRGCWSADLDNQQSPRDPSGSYRSASGDPACNTRSGMVKRLVEAINCEEKELQNPNAMEEETSTVALYKKAVAPGSYHRASLEAEEGIKEAYEELMVDSTESTQVLDADQPRLVGMNDGFMECGQAVIQVQNATQLKPLQVTDETSMQDFNAAANSLKEALEKNQTLYGNAHLPSGTNYGGRYRFSDRLSNSGGVEIPVQAACTQGDCSNNPMTRVGVMPQLSSPFAGPVDEDAGHDSGNNQTHKQLVADPRTRRWSCGAVGSRADVLGGGSTRRSNLA